MTYITHNTNDLGRVLLYTRCKLNKGDGRYE